MKQWIFQTLDNILLDPKSSKRILPISRLQDARSREACHTYPGALSTFLSGVWSFSPRFSAENVVRTGKKGSGIFHSRSRVKVEVTSENGESTSNTGSTGYVWLLFRRVHWFAKETQAFGWSSVSDAFSNSLSYFEHTNSRATTQNFQRKNTLYLRLFFAASFNGAKPEKTTIDSTKNLLIVYHDYSQNVNVMTRIKEIRFREEKRNALKLTENLENFRPN